MESGDLDAAAQMLTEDFIAKRSGQPRAAGRPRRLVPGHAGDEGRRPRLKIKVQDIFGVGDKVTVLLHFEGTHQDALQQIEATGRQVSFGSIEVYRIEGDKIAEEWVAPDMISLMQQISPAADD